MNIFIFDPSWCHCLSAVSSLMNYKGAHLVVTAQRLEDIVSCYGIARVGLHYDRALFRIPSIRCLENGDIKPKSRRAESMLKVVRATSEAEIPSAVFNAFPISYYEIGTNEIVPVETAFYRRIDPRTNVFERCYRAPNWRYILDELGKTSAIQVYLDF